MWKISDNVFISGRKTGRTKPKTPFAISGKQYLELKKNEQEKKQKELEEKERRKRVREEKRKMKNEQCSKNKRKVTDKHTTNASSKFVDIDTNFCGTCKGREGWDDGDLWISCNQCELWYHKNCLSENFVGMT